MKEKNLKDPNELVNLVEEKLKASNASYKIIEHSPEGNCEKVSVLRDNPIHAAAKALLINVRANKNAQCQYFLLILPGDRGIDFNKIKKKYNVKSAGMAEQNKIKELLDCEIGRVPPFSFNTSVKVLVDSELVRDNEKIYFSPGRLDRSVEMSAKEYQKIVINEGGEIFNFSKTIPQTQPKGTLFNSGSIPISTSSSEPPEKKVLSSGDVTNGF